MIKFIYYIVKKEDLIEMIKENIKKEDKSYKRDLKLLIVILVIENSKIFRGI